MAIRETINQYPRVVLAALIAGVVLILSLLVTQMRGGPAPSPARHAYFTDDDGQSFFVDDASKTAPFDHNGKEADMAHVFAAEHGSPFVGYMERAASAGARDLIEKARREMLETASKQAVPMPNSELLEQIRQNTEVKKPGDKKWVGAVTKDAAKVLVVTAPDGASAHEVWP